MSACGQQLGDVIQVTVAMPTYRRLDYALDALDSVLRQQTDLSYEVLVLDNAVDPKLQRAVEQRGQGTGIPLRYIPVPALGLHNGRHSAAKSAVGDLLFYIDDDIVADPHWLQSLFEAFADPRVHLATGPVLPAYEADPPGWLEGFWHHIGPEQRWCGQLSLLDLGAEQRHIDPELVFGANFAIRKASLLELGGFHPDSVPWKQRRYRGDGETAVAQRARERQLLAVYHPGAKVFHRVPAERLTKHYFERRALLQGISDSFRDYRRGVDALAAEQAGQGLLKAMLLRWRRLRQVLHERHVAPDLGALRKRMRACHREGYRYHRQKMIDDPTVRMWVERADFWHARLPMEPAQDAVPTEMADEQSRLKL